MKNWKGIIRISGINYKKSAGEKQPPAESHELHIEQFISWFAVNSSI